MHSHLAEAHQILGMVYMQKLQPEQAVAEAERAIALNPNLAKSYALLARILNFIGKPEEALEMAKKAVRLQPGYYLFELSHAYWLVGRYEKAIATQSSG